MNAGRGHLSELVPCARSRPGRCFKLPHSVVVQPRRGAAFRGSYCDFRHVAAARSFPAAAVLCGRISTMTESNATTQWPKVNYDSKLSKELNLMAHVRRLCKQGDALSVLDAVDGFCYQDNWMMHVSNKKGSILDDAVRGAKPKTVLELGTYCGYSAVRIGRLLSADAKMVTLDIDEEAVKRGTELVKLAGLEKVVTCLHGPLEKLSSKLREMGFKEFDFVFLDHWKDAYLRDLQRLEQEGFLHVGSVIAADNVIYPGAPDYLKYVRGNPRYDSTFHESHLEYKPEVKDGLEVSVVKNLK